MTKKLLLGLIILLCSLLLMGSVLDAQPSTYSDKLEVILLIDSSPSTSTSDKKDERIDAAASLLSYLKGLSQALGVETRVGFANFGGTLGRTIPMYSIWSDQVQEAIESDPVRTEEILYTDFRPALEYAASEFSKPGRDANVQSEPSRAVIIFTDGIPQLGDAALSAPDLTNYFSGNPISGDQRTSALPEILAELERMDASIYLVSKGDGLREQWQEVLGPEKYVSLDEEIQEPGERAEVYFSIATDLLGSDMSQARRLDGSDPAISRLTPYLERVAFSFLKDSTDVNLTVLDPANKAYEPQASSDPASLFQIYVVDEPEPGDWKVISSGGARLWEYRQKPRMILEFPDGMIEPNKPFELNARLLRNGNTVLDERLNLAPIVEKLPNLSAQMAPLEGEATGYVLSMPGFEQSGYYTTTVEVTLDGQPIETEPAQLIIPVFPIPRIVSCVVDGNLEPGNVIAVTADVARSEIAAVEIRVDVALLDANNQTTAGPARLRDDGQAPDDIAGDDTFAGRLPLPDEIDAQHLECKLLVRTSFGMPFTMLKEPAIVAIAQTTAETQTASPASAASATTTVTPSSTPPTPTPDKGAIERMVGEVLKALGALTRNPWALGVPLLLLIVAIIAVRNLASPRPGVLKFLIDLSGLYSRDGPHIISPNWIERGVAKIKTDLTNNREPLRNDRYRKGFLSLLHRLSDPHQRDLNPSLFWDLLTIAQDHDATKQDAGGVFWKRIRLEAQNPGLSNDLMEATKRGIVWEFLSEFSNDQANKEGR